MSSTNNHIPFALLVDFVDSRRKPDAQEQAHMADCLQCTRDLAWLERTLNVMRADRSEAAPLEVIARAKRLLRPRSGDARPGLRQRISAVLNFDSARMAPAFGLRSGTGAERQLIFNAGHLDVDLRVALQGAAWTVAGQILGSDDGRNIELNGPQGVAQAPINAQGEFVLPLLPAGHYRLTVQLADIDMDLPELDLGES
jgi:hypothetical protein